MEHEELAWPWLIWLTQSGLGTAMRRSLWLYPAAEIVHICGIVLLVGAAAMFDLRLLGVGRRLSVAEVARYLLPWSRRGLAFVALFHRGIFRSVMTWDRDVRTPLAARAAGVISLVVWTAVVAAGRLLAYL